MNSQELIQFGFLFYHNHMIKSYDVSEDQCFEYKCAIGEQPFDTRYSLDKKESSLFTFRKNYSGYHEWLCYHMNLMPEHKITITSKGIDYHHVPSDIGFFGRISGSFNLTVFHIDKSISPDKKEYLITICHSCQKVYYATIMDGVLHHSSKNEFLGDADNNYSMFYRQLFTGALFSLEKNNIYFE